MRKAASAARASTTPATGRRARRCSTRPASTRPAAPAKGRPGSSRRCSALPRSSSSSCSGSASAGAGSALMAAFAVAVYPPFIHSTGELMSEPPAILTLPAAVLAFLWASERERLRAWLLPGLLFGLTAMFRPEYLFVAVAFVVLAAAPGSGLGCARLEARPRRRRPAAGRSAAADRALDDPQRRRARARGADLDRQRQGALRRHLPARRRRIPAGQGAALRALRPRIAAAATPKR